MACHLLISRFLLFALFFFLSLSLSLSLPVSLCTCLSLHEGTHACVHVHNFESVCVCVCLRKCSAPEKDHTIFRYTVDGHSLAALCSIPRALEAKDNRMGHWATPGRFGATLRPSVVVLNSVSTVSGIRLVMPSKVHCASLSP